MAKKQPKFIRKTPLRRKEPGIGYVIPFFVVLAVLTVVSFIIPLRPTVSYIEKRELAKFPEFSAEALVSGDYFDEITTWFSDTFPGRETWLEVSSYTKSFYGSSDIMIGDEEEKFDDPSIYETGSPTEEPTEVATTSAETGPAAEPPTEGTIILEEEEVTAPAAPVEEWGGVDAGANEITKSGTVIQIGDSLFTREDFNATYSSRYVSVVNHVAEKYADQGIRVVSAAPPQAIGVLIEPEYMQNLKSIDQADVLNYFNENLSDEVYFVDTVSVLREHNDEYIYFRTDHHWTALGAYYVYEAICEQLDLEAAALDDFELWDQGRFIGSLYYKAPKTKALTEDVVYAYNPVGDLNTRIYKSGTSGFEHTVLTDMSKSNANSKYMTFLAGDHPLVRIINNDLPDAGNVLVIKDSFGNAMAPFFTQNYHKVYVVDYRYYSESMSTLIKSFDIDDVIFLPNVSEIQTKAVSDLLQKYKN